MTIELTMLALAPVFGLVQIVSQRAEQKSLNRLSSGGSSRHEPRPPLTPIAGRLERALANFLETSSLFAAAVLVAHGPGGTNG